jgi:inner membrane protein
MTGKVHKAAGIVFGVASIVVVSYFGDEHLAITYNETLSTEIIEGIKFGDVVKNTIIVLASWFGSILPDIDHPTSTISKKFTLLSIPYRILQFIFGKFKSTKHFVGHRGITHSLLFLSIPIIIGLFFVTNEWIVVGLFGLSVGILSHLVMDMFNPTGVPLLLPLSKHKFRLLPKKLCIKTK